MQNDPIQVEVTASPALTELGATLNSTGQPLWRTQLIRVLHILGILATFLGGAEFLNLLAFFPPEVAKWLIVAGPALATSAKPLVLLFGDYLDDGVKNDSFKISLGLLLMAGASLAGAITSTSCQGYTLDMRTPYGSARSEEDGSLTILPKIPKRIKIPIYSEK